jgi:hypothetical protein
MLQSSSDLGRLAFNQEDAGLNPTWSTIIKCSVSSMVEHQLYILIMGVQFSHRVPIVCLFYKNKLEDNPCHNTIKGVVIQVVSYL